MLWQIQTLGGHIMWPIQTTFSFVAHHMADPDFQLRLATSYGGSRHHVAETDMRLGEVNLICFPYLFLRWRGGQSVYSQAGWGHVLICHPLDLPLNGCG